MTDQIDFPTPTDSPPVILRAPGGPPIGEMINLIKGQWPTGYDFNVTVRDMNVDQELEARVRLVKKGESNPRFEPLIVQRGDKPERELTVRVETNDLLNNRCHRLDLAVSGSFIEARDAQDRPVFDAVAGGSTDLAQASWWIFEGDLLAGDSAGIAESCPTRFMVPPPAAGMGGTQ